MYTTEQLIVHQSPMETLVFEPAGAGVYPGVLVAQHLPVAHAGLDTDPFTIDIGEKLAAAGYVAVIPFMFHWWPKELDMKSKVSAWRDDWNIADLEATFAFLSEKRNVDANRVGIMGHCWGGRVTWLGACTNPNYSAAALFYGGRIKIGLGESVTAPINMADQIRCPVLGIFGNDDQNPSPDDVADLDSALNSANVPHEFHQYEGAGHGFQDFVNVERYRKEQADDAWEKLFAFFDRYLKS